MYNARADGAIEELFKPVFGCLIAIAIVIWLKSLQLLPIFRCLHCSQCYFVETILLRLMYAI